MRWKIIRWGDGGIRVSTGVPNVIEGVSWELLRSLATKSNLPWCVIGDFSDMMFIDEKRGGREHPRNLLEGFAETVYDCGLHDLGFVGEKFMWEKSRGSITGYKRDLIEAWRTMSGSKCFCQRRFKYWR